MSILDNLGLTPEQKAFRRNSIGGSDANIIMSGNDERILQLWKEKSGKAEGEDLSEVLQVMLGSFTESFNRAWYEKKHKKIVTNVGDQMICLDHPFMACTLDGMVNGEEVWEAKHVSAFAKEDEVLEKYMPQLTHNMIVCGVKSAVLSVIFGNHKHETYSVSLDPDYAAKLIAAEENFWNCIHNDIQPVIVHTKYQGPVERKVDMSGNNSWSAAAADFLGSLDLAKQHDKAKSILKELVEDDVVEASGHGIIAKRSKTGAITIKETK